MPFFFVAFLQGISTYTPSVKNVKSKVSTQLIQAYINTTIRRLWKSAQTIQAQNTPNGSHGSRCKTAAVKGIFHNKNGFFSMAKAK